MSDTILTDKTLESKSQEDDENENVNVNENENENVNDETLMSSDKDDDYDDENKNENENEDDDETMSQNEIIKETNNLLDEIINKSKLFEDQIESLKRIENLDQCCSVNDFDDKELKSKIFKPKLAHFLKMIDKKLFEQIFGDTLETLANKLINTTNKGENQIIFKNINANKKKLYEQEKKFPYNWVIQPTNQRTNLINSIKLILDFNENENENVKSNKNENVNENENENVNENDETLMPSDKDDDDVTMSQNEKNERNITIKNINDYFDKMIDKSKSFEEQMKSLKEIKNLDEYYSINDYGDKKLKFKIFKLKLASLSNVIDEKIFKQIFGHTLETLVNKLINTTSEKENQIIVKNIDKNKDKVYEEDDFFKFTIQPNSLNVDLTGAVDLILDFNETI